VRRIERDDQLYGRPSFQRRGGRSETAMLRRAQVSAVIPSLQARHYKHFFQIHLPTR